MFHFTEDCMIGIEELDDEHRHLFSLINKGMELLGSAYLTDRYEQVHELLEELDRYAEEHFTHEEAYMAQIRDPELIRQRVQHTLFRDKIRDWLFCSLESGAEQQELLEELMPFLTRWLYHHIIGSDIMIGKLPPLEEWMIRENPCEFTDDYLTGIQLVDDEHKELFRIVEKAYHVTKAYSVPDGYDEILDILEQLGAYTRLHFKDEEEYMENIHYEGLEAQKNAHAAFVHRLESVNLLEIDEDPQKYMEGLIEFLLGWLINHIMYTDKKIPQQDV